MVFNQYNCIVRYHTIILKFILLFLTIPTYGTYISTKSGIYTQMHRHKQHLQLLSFEGVQSRPQCRIIIGIVRQSSSQLVHGYLLIFVIAKTKTIKHKKWQQKLNNVYSRVQLYHGPNSVKEPFPLASFTTKRAFNHKLTPVYSP